MQNPGAFLTDSVLKSCQIEKDILGFPAVRSGGFALTYKIRNNGKEWALRCFHKLSAIRNVVYPHICKFIKTHPSKYFVDIDYQPNGIRYQGSFYPISLMRWVKGETLGTFISINYKSSKVIEALMEQFLGVVDELNRLKIAHGDLSHSNIMIENNQMVLIDYDGMYIPSFKGAESSEIGNKHFQHPGRRSRHFYQEIDSFSEIVIYLALKTILHAPKLYEDYGKGGEGLLFSRTDIIDPDNSPLISEIEKIPRLSQYIYNFKQICKTDISNVPLLLDFINNIPVKVTPATDPELKTYQLSPSDLPIDARNKEELLKFEDELVVVIGLISKVWRGTTKNGHPYVFLNIGSFPNNTFTVVLWSEMLEMIERSGINPELFESKWISVSGILDTYEGKPQIVLDSPANITTLSEQEARRRLSFCSSASSKANTSFVSTSPDRNVTIKVDEKTEKLNKLYGSGGIFNKKG